MAEEASKKRKREEDDATKMADGIQNMTKCVICYQTMTQPVCMPNCSHMMCLQCFETILAKSVKLIQKPHVSNQPNIASVPGLAWHYKPKFEAIHCPMCKEKVLNETTRFSEWNEVEPRMPPQPLLEIMKELGQVQINNTCPHCNKAMPSYDFLLRQHLPRCRWVECSMCQQYVHFEGTNESFRKNLSNHVMKFCNGLQCCDCFNVGNFSEIHRCFTIHRRLHRLVAEYNMLQSEVCVLKNDIVDPDQFTITDQTVYLMDEVKRGLCNVANMFGKRVDSEETDDEEDIVHVEGQ